MLAGLEQAELAKLIGTSRTSISNYETGRSEPTITTFVLWAEATRATLEWIAEGVVRPEGFEPPAYCSVAGEVVCQCGHSDFKHDDDGNCSYCSCLGWAGVEHDELVLAA